MEEETRVVGFVTPFAQVSDGSVWHAGVVRVHQRRAQLPEQGAGACACRQGAR